MTRMACILIQLKILIDLLHFNIINRRKMSPRVLIVLLGVLICAILVVEGQNATRSRGFRGLRATRIPSRNGGIRVRRPQRVRNSSSVRFMTTTPAPTLSPTPAPELNWTSVHTIVCSSKDLPQPLSRDLEFCMKNHSMEGVSCI